MKPQPIVYGVTHIVLNWEEHKFNHIYITVEVTGTQIQPYIYIYITVEVTGTEKTGWTES